MHSTDDIACGVELRKVARIQPGYLSRQGVRSTPGGTHLLLQAKDVSLESGIQPDDAVRFRPQRNPDLYQISRGDILVAARGRDHRAYLVTEDLVDTLASNVFYIVRPRTNDVVPAYLAWWMNLPCVQAQLDAGSRGTGIGYISRQTMEHLPIVVPPLDVQDSIAKVIGLWQEKKNLQIRLDQKREQLIQAICRQAVRQ